MRRGDGRPKIQGAAVRVDQLGLGVAVQQGMVLVLAVKRNESVAQLAQLAWCCGSSVDPRHAAFADLPLQRDRIEDRLHRGSFSAVTHLLGRCPGAERQAERVDDQRLAASSLARQKIETWSEMHGRFRDQGQVANLELPQHYFLGTSGLPQPSLSASRT